MSKVYGYGRLALASEEEMTEQIKMIEHYCKDHGLMLSGCFCDNGVSGLNSYRNEFNKMLYALQDGDIVVVKDIARLSRDMTQYMALAELMETLNITLKTIY